MSLPQELPSHPTDARVQRTRAQQALPVGITIPHGISCRWTCRAVWDIPQSGTRGHLHAARCTPTRPRSVALQRRNLPASLNKSLPIGWFAMIAMSASCGSPAFSVSDSASPTSVISVGDLRRRCPTAVPTASADLSCVEVCAPSGCAHVIAVCARFVRVRVRDPAAPVCAGLRASDTRWKTGRRQRRAKRGLPSGGCRGLRPSSRGANSRRASSATRRRPAAGRSAMASCDGCARGRRPCCRAALLTEKQARSSALGLPEGDLLAEILRALCHRGDRRRYPLVHRSVALQRAHRSIDRSIACFLVVRSFTYRSDRKLHSLLSLYPTFVCLLLSAHTPLARPEASRSRACALALACIGACVVRACLLGPMLA